MTIGEIADQLEELEHLNKQMFELKNREPFYSRHGDETERQVKSRHKKWEAMVEKLDHQIRIVRNIETLLS